jgi:hypothetical protein
MSVVVDIAHVKMLKHHLQLFSLSGLPADTIYDPHSVAVVRASGPVDFIDSSKYTFQMNVVQYTSYMQRGGFPMKIIIPAESKWQSDRLRALPKLPRVVTLTGILTNLPKTNETNEDVFGVTITRDLEYVGLPDPGAVVPALSTSSISFSNCEL